MIAGFSSWQKDGNSPFPVIIDVERKLQQINMVNLVHATLELTESIIKRNASWLNAPRPYVLRDCLFLGHLARWSHCANVALNVNIRRCSIYYLYYVNASQP